MKIRAPLMMLVTAAAALLAPLAGAQTAKRYEVKRVGRDRYEVRPQPEKLMDDPDRTSMGLVEYTSPLRAERDAARARRFETDPTKACAHLDKSRELADAICGSQPEGDRKKCLADAAAAAGVTLEQQAALTACREEASRAAAERARTARRKSLDALLEIPEGQRLPQEQARIAQLQAGKQRGARR